MEVKNSSKEMTEFTVADDLAEDKQTRKRQEQEDALADLATSLSTTFGEYVDNKAAIERRLIRDYTQYHGQYYKEEEVGFNETSVDGRSTSKRSKVFVNITRSKTDSAEARMSDMLFPNDDRNWDIQPTPVPELSHALSNKQPLQLAGQDIMKPAAPGQEPQPMTEGDLAAAEIADAHERCKKMKQEIDDQFVEANYPVEARKAIRDAVILGTGILKGPMQVGKTRRAWVPVAGQNDEVVHVLEIHEVVKPYVYRVDPWNFFPDMAVSDIRDAEMTFEVHYKTPQQMKEYLKTPGFMETQVRSVLEKSPKDTHVREHREYMEQKRAIAGIDTGVYDENRYQVVEYHGPITKDIMERLGVSIDEDDPLEMYQAFVWFVGDTVIKFALHHLDSEDKLYSIFNWEKDDSNIFGYGVPYTMRAPQQVINASWRMIMDNSGLSTGPQIVINRRAIRPADGSWEMTPRKIWHVIEEDIDVSKVFKTFNIDSHQQELLNIFNTAKQLADEETNLPMMAQGMPGTVGRTFGGMSMAMNAANITLRRAVKYFDDDITMPIVTRFYDWNMQFNKKPEIKGDFEVKATGSSVLLVKELQSQGLLALMQYVGHPVFGPMLREDELLRLTAKSMHVNPQSVVKDSATIAKERAEAQQAAEQAGPQVSPDTQAKLEAQMQIAQMNAEQKNRELEFRMIELQQRGEELVATLASKENISIAEAETKYNLKGAEMDWDMQKFYDELRVKQQQGSGI